MTVMKPSETILSALSIEPMQRSDLETVMALDRLCFRSPWTEDSYITELNNRAAQYYVARVEGTIIGYGGMWVIDHEGHITTLGVTPANRRQGIGERLLVVMLREAIERQAHRVTLEVRVGNAAARSLYERYAFHEVERRRGYYTDNGEDALIMRADNVHLPAFAALLHTAGSAYAP